MTAATATQTPRRRLHGDEGPPFERHHEPLLRSVGRAVNASQALIEDACAFAWAQLVRTQPERGPRLFGWLRTVAIHEAFRLSGIERRDARLEELTSAGDGHASDPDGWEALLPGDLNLDDAIEARRALHVLAELPERQRRYLTLFAAGYRYDEITRLTGATYTNVNKHLTRARESVRRADAA